jgi:hypothetical protein
MSVIPQTPELPGSFVLLVPYQGSALDPLGILSIYFFHRNFHNTYRKREV